MINSLKMIEIEINKFCNRKCEWCPNKEFNRTQIEPLDIITYIKLLQELKSNNFKGSISFSRNNEPFAIIKDFIKYVQLAKDILPDSKLVTNTNGDFLTKEIIENIKLDEISIMDYDNNGYEYCINKLISLNAKIESVEDNIIYAYTNDKKFAYCVNWQKNTLLEDRGGFLQEVEGMKFRNEKSLRNYSCIDPSIFIAVDYNGNIMPCCSMRSDNPNHKEYILGNIYKESLTDILHKNKTIKLIYQITTEIEDKLPTPCKFCHKGLGRYTRDNPSIYYSERYTKGGIYECL